jgi:hypothetical protein
LKDGEEKHEESKERNGKSEKKKDQKIFGTPLNVFEPELKKKQKTDKDHQAANTNILDKLSITQEQEKIDEIMRKTESESSIVSESLIINLFYFSL